MKELEIVKFNYLSLNGEKNVEILKSKLNESTEIIIKLLCEMVTVTTNAVNEMKNIG